KGGRGVVRIAEVDDQVAGVAIAAETNRDPWLPNEGAAELRAIYVDPDCRGKGVARTLVDDVIGWAQERDLDTVSVHTFADHPEEAEALKAIGFQEYRVQLEYPLRDQE
ncbi:MAG: GNAT family N-acetyltransferase, partial [Candidatus Thermoplasmatota archaeon]|nr:GNAT family N-acetyltransferase [Candidatus Thermoplasmatota archaeon]